MTRALVLRRRRPGRKIGEAVREMQERLEAAGWKVDSLVVRRKSALRHHAAHGVDAGVDVVVAVGGDGAVLQVVNALAETKVALGIIPMGTGNLLAGNLGIPHQLDRAVDVLVNGHHRRIDLGRVTVGGKDHDFTVACGVGFDARVMQATDTREKRRLGKLAYLVQAIRQAQHVRDVTHEITLDGRRSSRKATQVLIANFGQMGSLVETRREIQPDDGLLDVIVVRAPCTGPGARPPGRMGGASTTQPWHECGRSCRSSAGQGRADRDQARTTRGDGWQRRGDDAHHRVDPTAALTVIVPIR